MSVSLTISNLDDEMYRRLQAEAQRRCSDVESIAKSALARGLDSVSASSVANGPPYRDLDFLSGTWTEVEAKEFLNIVDGFRCIDTETWQ